MIDKQQTEETLREGHRHFLLRQAPHILAVVSSTDSYGMVHYEMLNTYGCRKEKWSVDAFTSYYYPISEDEFLFRLLEL